MWKTADPSPNQPLTESMIVAAEAALTVRFPASYIAALRIKNGGSIVADFARLQEQTVPRPFRRFIDHGYVRVSGINGIGSSDTSVLATEYLIAEWGLPDGLVIIDGAGHAWLAFDYRETDVDPPIVLVNSDSGDTIRVASDFAKFSGSLVRREEVYDQAGNFIG